MVSWEYLWSTLRCRREAGVSPLLSIGWWYLSSVSPKRHCCRVSAADKGRWVYPLDPRPDSVVLYSECTSGKRRAWYLPDDRHTASLVGLRGGWRHARTKVFTRTYGFNAAVPGPKLPTTIKARYLNCKIRPYIPNPQRCFKCQRFGHSQTSCRGQLTCSRCATVGHSSTDCTLEPKCINCSQPHSADSKLCLKWKTEKQIQEIKTNKNITYLEARKLIAPPISQSYAQATKSSKLSATTQTDENITKTKCPPLKLLQPSSLLKPNISPYIPSTSASSAQADLLTSSSPIAAISESESVNPIPNNVPSTSNISAFPSNSGVQPTSASTSIQDTKLKAKTRARKRKKELLKKINDAIIEIKMAPHKPRKSTPEQDSEDEDMIEYNPDEFDPDDYVQKYYNIEEYKSVITPTYYKNVKK
ncbi:uncharacterized protein TNCV_398871 [Trichonephila clavipes]|uniref:CCHC-type domain-containing protein n=1 Tax=Trichonephila clavipes TaxID=2585209 RepID=A0A8X7B7K1_TRICX|nr:uncharacterized protein TNCV_398871 [Trichonephila clavipes]